MFSCRTGLLTVVSLLVCSLHLGCDEAATIGLVSPDGVKFSDSSAGTSYVSPPLRLWALDGGLLGVCGIGFKGKALCWGDTGTTSSLVPAAIPLAGTGRIRSISTYGNHTCVVDSKRDAYCWGSGAFGELGDGTIGGASATAVPVVGQQKFRSVAVGQNHTCGLEVGGTVFCWGRNDLGQLGDGMGNDSGVPVQILGGHVFRQISSSPTHTCGVTITREAYCWGSNFRGKLGNGTTTDSNVPTKVLGGASFRAISTEGNHTCGVAAGGRALCWGSNTGGQLGDGSNNDSSVPRPVVGGNRFRSVAGGGSHSCGLNVQGRAFCWGGNGSGYLGNGTTVNSNVPVPVSGGLRFRSLGLGSTMSCGIRLGQGWTYCWGWNGFGQLGNGTQVDSSVPVPVQGF